MNSLLSIGFLLNRNEVRGSLKGRQFRSNQRCIHHRPYKVVRQLNDAGNLGLRLQAPVAATLPGSHPTPSQVHRCPTCLRSGAIRVAAGFQALGAASVPAPRRRITGMVTSDVEPAASG